MQNTTHTYRQGLQDGLPIGLGYLAVSFGFGIAVVNSGLPGYLAVLISMTNLTSAGQMAGLGILVAGGTALEMAAVQLVINLRYALMGLSLTQKLDGGFTTGHRFACAAFLTDEIFAMAASKPGSIGVRYFYGLAGIPYVGWTLGTLLGAVAGTLLPSMLSAALGLAIYGMFVAIVVPAVQSSRGAFVAVLCAAALSCLFHYLPWFSNLSQGFALIISAVAGALVAAWLCPQPEEVAP